VGIVAMTSTDLMLSSALYFTLHATKNTGRRWSAKMWRVLKIGGILFARLASTIGMETKVELIEGSVITCRMGQIVFS
jgi:hypothetical protein